MKPAKSTQCHEEHECTKPAVFNDEKKKACAFDIVNYQRFCNHYITKVQLCVFPNSIIKENLSPKNRNFFNSEFLPGATIVIRSLYSVVGIMNRLTG